MHWHLGPAERSSSSRALIEREGSMPTVREHFNVQTACWREYGGCTTFHAVHVHVDFSPWGRGTPKCAGGDGGWANPGSPNLVAFTKAVRAKFPELQLEFFNCRKIEGSDSWSQHSMWNAVDIMTPTVEIGQKVWDWLNSPFIAPTDHPPFPGRLLRLQEIGRASC